MSEETKIPKFKAAHLKPRKQRKRPPVKLVQRVVNGKRFLEAPPPGEVARPWRWQRDL